MPLSSAKVAASAGTIVDKADAALTRLMCTLWKRMFWLLVANLDGAVAPRLQKPWLS